jgi:hypothetical protein
MSDAGEKGEYKETVHQLLILVDFKKAYYAVYRYLEHYCLTVNGDV